MLSAQYKFSVPWSRYSWALYNISHALCFACGQTMAAASGGMFESARPDRPLMSLEVERVHSSQGRSKKWSKLSVVSSPQPQPPLPPSPPPPNGWGEGRRDGWHFNATWVVVLVLPVVQAKYALNYCVPGKLRTFVFVNSGFDWNTEWLGCTAEFAGRFIGWRRTRSHQQVQVTIPSMKKPDFLERSDENGLKDLFPAVKYVDLPHRFSSDL